MRSAGCQFDMPALNDCELLQPICHILFQIFDAWIFQFQVGKFLIKTQCIMSHFYFGLLSKTTLVWSNWLFGYENKCVNGMLHYSISFFLLLNLKLQQYTYKTYWISSKPTKPWIKSIIDLQWLNERIIEIMFYSILNNSSLKLWILNWRFLGILLVDL